MTGPLDYIHETAIHQLRNAADDIECEDGIVADFDYDEETDDYFPMMAGGVRGEVSTERTVTLEITYILPE
jgi:hypothetical protein